MSTILVVEDEAKLLRLIELNLGEEGHNIVKAPNAGDALTQLRRQEIDLVLTDLRLPGMNGLEVKRTDASLPVVVMTEFGSVETAVEAMKAGAKQLCSETLFHGRDQAGSAQGAGCAPPVPGESVAQGGTWRTL